MEMEIEIEIEIERERERETAMHPFYNLTIAVDLDHAPKTLTENSQIASQLAGFA